MKDKDFAIISGIKPSIDHEPSEIDELLQIVPLVPGVEDNGIGIVDPGSKETAMQVLVGMTPPLAPEPINVMVLAPDPKSLPSNICFTDRFLVYSQCCPQDRL